MVLESNDFDVAERCHAAETCRFLKGYRTCTSNRIKTASYANKRKNYNTFMHLM
jgi:hypothetical protein